MSECWKCQTEDEPRMREGVEYIFRVKFRGEERWECYEHVLESFLTTINQFGKIRIERPEKRVPVEEEKVEK